MAGTSNSITTHNVLSGVLNSDNVISGLVNTAFNPAYALVNEAGAQIVLFLNNNDYKMYAQLKDKSGNLIYTSNIIDLPLETMVVDGRYDSNTKKLILVLDNGNEIEVPLEALINGLVNEDDLIANYYDNNEIDALLEGYWTKVELTQEDIDNWNAKQEYLNQGDGIEISAEAALKGNTYQESTTGKNLCYFSNFTEHGVNFNGSEINVGNTNGDAIYVGSNFNLQDDTSKSGKTYTIYACVNGTKQTGSSGTGLSINFSKTGVPVAFQVGLASSEGSFNNRIYVGTITLGENEVFRNVSVVTNNAITVNINVKVMIVEGSYTPQTIGDYEPYTGNQPSPNPDYPQPIQVVSGNNSIKVEGKNLIEMNGPTTSYAGITLTNNNDGTFTVTGTSTGAIGFSISNSKPVLKANTAYTQVVKTVSGTQAGSIVPSVRNSQGQIVYNYFSNNQTKTSSEEVKISGYPYYISQAGITVNWTFKVMLCEGTDTTYEAYKGQTYEINLGNIELCKIGDYQDYIYKDSGKWYLNKQIGKVVLNGSEEWIYNASPTDRTVIILFNYISSKNTNYYSNYFVKDSSTLNRIVLSTPSGIYMSLADTITGITSSDTNSQKLSKIKTWLSTNNTIVYYVLATPTYTEITDTTLIEQLDNLSIGFSNNWVKNISQTNADLPFEIEYDNTNLTISASSNLVRNTDYANYSTAGVVKSNLSFETDNNGGARCSIIEYSNYPSANNRNFISKGTLENVITGKELTNKTYVDAADAVFESELFDDGVISIEDSTEANINNTMNKSQLKIDLKGNTYQESTTGKNLFDNVYGQTGNVYTKHIDAPSPLGSVDCYPINLLPNTQYTLKIDMNGYQKTSTWIAGVCFENGDVISLLQSNSMEDITTTTFTTDSTGVIYVGQRYGFTYGETGRMDLFLQTAKIQLEKGTTATDYEPYTNGASPNPDYPQDVQVVTGDNTIKVEGKNLYTNEIEYNNSVLASNGTINSATGFIISKPISIDISKDIYVSFVAGSLTDKAMRVGYYDGNDNFISRPNFETTPTKLTPPSNAQYLRLSYDARNFSNVQVEYNQATEYTPYVSQTYEIDLRTSKNLFDISTITRGYELNSNTGGIQVNANWWVSDYIGIKPNTDYTSSNISSLTKCWYDSNKNFISRVQTTTGTSPSNARYLRVNGTLASIESNPNLMIEEGNTATTYQAYSSIELCKIGDYQDKIAKSTGKNLFDKNNINGLNVYLDPTNNKLVSNNNNKSIYISCKPNTTYTISKTPSKRFGVAYTYTTPENNTAIYGTITNYDGASITITTDTNAQYLVVWLINSNISGEISYQTAIDTLQIEYGNQVTTYEPYGKVWYLNKQIGKVVLDGSESYSCSEGNKNTLLKDIGMISADIGTTGYVKCNYYEEKGNSSADSVDYAICRYFATQTYNYQKLVFKNKNMTSASDFTTWLSTHNTTVYYVLATPTYTEITDSTLIEQLNNIEKAYSYDTQTNISQTNDDMPFILDINAIADNVNGLKLENENQEYKTNKVIELSSNSTDDEYPSAKCVYDIVGNIEAVLAAMDSGSGV